MPDDQAPTSRDHDGSAEAFAASMDSVFNASPAPRPTEADRLEALLALLDAGPEHLSPSALAQSKADAVDRIMRAVPGASADGLSAADAAAVDRALDYQPSQHRTNDRAPGVAERDERVRSLLGLLDTTASGRAERIARTIERVRMESPMPSGVVARLSPVAEQAAPAGSFRLRELVAIAAAVLVATAVLWPMSNAGSRQQKLAQNAQNLAVAGMGMGMFASDNDGRLPSARQRATSPQWWRVGTPEHSHSANLFVLISDGYASMDALASPFNQFAPVRRTAQYEADWRSSSELSYSYQLFAGEPPRFSDRRVEVLLSDRSPVAQSLALGREVDAERNSSNQDGKGQHVLFRDLGVRLLQSPTLERTDGTSDNIWLPDRSNGPIANRALLHGLQPRDVFLGP